MPRALAPAALIAICVAVAVAVAATAGSEPASREADNDRRGGVNAVPPVSPALRTIADLALPGGPGQVDSGVGVYPSLATPERLAFPGPAALAQARRFTSAREGEVAFAVADDRGGITGLGARRPFSSGSLSKAMILVAYLRKLAEGHADPSQSDLLSLGYMIRLSDNASADTIYSRVGDKRLIDLARRAGMKGFAVSGDWANATVTPPTRRASSWRSTASCHAGSAGWPATSSGRSASCSRGGSRSTPVPAGGCSSRAVGAPRMTARWCTKRPCSRTAREGWPSQ